MSDRMKKCLLILPLIFSLVLPFQPAPAAAKEAETINTKRAAKALLEGVRDFFKDLTEYQSLKTDEEKINYILTKGPERIILKSGELAWDRLKTEMGNVAAAKMREALFKEQVPSMMNKVLVEGMSTSAAWTAANAEIVSKIDTRVNAIKTGIVGAKVIVNALAKYRKTGDLRAGFEAFGKGAADEIIEYLVPGWKLYRVAQAIVEALGNYIVGYAFDTALESKVAAILPFPPQSNPKAFAEWIQTIDIPSYVQKEWDDQLAYSGWYLKYDGKTETKEESGDAMKNAIIASLERMKADVLREKARLQQIQNEFDAKIRELEAKTNDANKQAMRIVDGIYSEAEPFLKLIEDYKTNLYGNVKKDAEATVAEAESEMSAIRTSVAYNPLDYSTILSDMEAALTEVTDNYRSGYDYKKAMELWDNYLETRKRVIAENGKQFADLAAQLGRTTDPPTQNRLSNALYSEWPKKQAKDFEILGAKERVVMMDASQRCKKMVDDLKADIAEMNEEWMKALTDYRKAEEELSDKIKSTFKYPDAYSNPEAGIQQNTPYVRDERLPEEVLGAIEPLKLFRENIAKDASLSSGIQNQHKDNLKKLQAVYEALKTKFERVVQKDYREIKGTGIGDPETWTAMMHVTWTAGEPLQALQDLRDEGTPVVTVFIGVRPWDYAKDEPDIPAEYAKGMKWLDEYIANTESKQTQAGYSAAFWKLLDAPELRKYETDALRGVDIERFAHMKGGKWGYAVKPEESDAVQFITDMKKAWALRENQILQAKKVREASLKLGKSPFQYADPAQDKLLDQYLKIPELIAEYEKILAQESQKFKTSREAAKGNLQLWQKKFEELKAGTRYAIPSNPLLEKLEKFKKETVNLIKNTEILVPDATETIDGMKAIDKEVDGMITDCKAKMAAGPPPSTGGGSSSSSSGASGGQGGAGGSSGGGAPAPQAPVSLGSYQIYDTRLNTHSLNNVSSDVVLTQNDLIQGNIEVTGRLGNMDRIQKLLMSEDSGRTWAEIQVSQNIVYRFSPMAGKNYRLVLKIKTDDGQEVTLELFPSVRNILYQNISYTQLATEAVTKIANAYEKQDVSGFAALISRDYIGNRVFLEEGVRFDFDMFLDIRLKIYIDRIEKRGDMYVVETHWEKSQSPRKTGQQQMTTGKTVMMFVLEDGTFKIKNLRGNLLYATLSPEIAQASGLSQKVVEEIRVAQEDRVPVQPGAGQTENSGGVTSTSNIQSGNFSLTQTLAHAGAGWIQEFSFASQQVYTVDNFGPTYDFRRREGWMEVKSSNGIADMGAISINSVTEAPASGYATSVGATEGHTYAIQISDGTYALVQSTSWGDVLPSTTSFKYKHQKNGTRSFS